MTPKYKFFIAETNNIFNKTLPETTLGYALSNGVLYPNSAFTTTGYIAIIGGGELYVNVDYSIAFYDSNKIFIPNSGHGTGQPIEKTYNIPMNARYFRITVVTANIDSTIVNYYRKTNPNYKDDITKDYKLESNQRFYRADLSGKMTFQNSDFDYINGQPFETEFVFVIYKSNDNGVTW